MPEEMQRRDLLKKGLALSAGVAAFSSLEEKILLAASSDNAKTPPPSPPPEDAVSEMPMGKIGPLKVSRLICGGNLTSGFAHSRDLIYVSTLLKHYFTDEKIFETWRLCEECGINTAILRLDDDTIRLLPKYWNERGGKFQWIAQIKPTEESLEADIRRAADNGAVGAHLQGQAGDKFTKDGRVDLLARSLELMRENKLVAGIGGHEIAVMMACEKAGLKPDFYMKTFHSGDYWSAKASEEHDNIWAEKPEETIAFMKTVNQPWIGFKVLAAGAISPKKGFRYAFENGADFLCVGLFDFQVREDAIIAKKTLAEDLKRERPWRG